ncbi:hypothetical protein [Candidatus Uabimicrobium amorphum]|uniref:Uncharacterized protein n=1 Tax=Uabimicrobium amorphum TaxID=2596890 RepID=A0A5S9F4Y3_UABAM|nr:hypothetical protein [Candidatus Uabimicrobium amorphum]BBM86042.1 hypothetical protein UABAM_04428 [Candidatus Uabimicrobium amorphum]
MNSYTSKDVEQAWREIVLYYLESESKRWGRDPSTKACIDAIRKVESIMQQVNICEDAQQYLRALLHAVKEGAKSFQAYDNNEVASGIGYFHSIPADLFYRFTP